MSGMVRCQACRMEYDPLLEVTCPACTSGHVHHATNAPALPRIDPRKSARARAAVEAVERSMFREREAQSAARSRRRNNRRIASIQIAIGIPIITVGGLAWPRLSTGELAGVYGPAVALAPILIGAAFVVLGVVRLARGST